VTAIAASGLKLARGGRVILRDVSFNASSGEFVAVIGANGAGKSTLLMLLSGLLKPDEGKVTLDARDLAERTRTEIARLRAYLPQNPRCEWPISVERLIALGLTPTLPAFGALPAPMQTKIGEMLSQWDLHSHRAQAATTLSGGELTRAMLARALVGEPDILIADEPVAGLDPRHALDTAARLRQLADTGKLVIAAMHDLTLAARHATRIVALGQGTIVADGTPDAVLKPPLLRSVFDVDASISGAGPRAFVDFVSPLRH
jgi:iron complex transport system ATP-binding protein